jgi:hypothetical protein
MLIQTKLSPLFLIVYICIQFNTSVSANTDLPTLSKEQVDSIIAQKKSPYALVITPSSGRKQSVDLVTLNPKNLTPVARATVPNMACLRLHGAKNGDLICSSTKIKNATGGFDFSLLNSTWYSADLKKTLVFPMDKSNRNYSRTRISADGTAMAWTNFNTDAGYEDIGMEEQLFTSTYVGRVINNTPVSSNLRQWSLFKDGTKISNENLNYWGVTYHPKNSQTFLVTVSFKGIHYLAQGDMVTQQIKILHPNVECPSYSPDGQLIAFKKRKDATTWSPAILELRTFKEIVFNQLNESVDDQIDWLDANTLIYEIKDTPLIGRTKINLHTLNIADVLKKPKAASKVRSNLWLTDARSAAVFKPSN